MSKHNRHHGVEHSHEHGDAQTMTAPAADEGGVEVANGTQSGVLAAFKSARDFAGNVRQKAVTGAKVTDEAVRNHPYKALAVAAGVGVLVGMFLIRRGSRKA